MRAAWSALRKDELWLAVPLKLTKPKHAPAEPEVVLVEDSDDLALKVSDLSKRLVNPWCASRQEAA